MPLTDHIDIDNTSLYLRVNMCHESYEHHAQPSFSSTKHSDRATDGLEALPPKRGLPTTPTAANRVRGGSVGECVRRRPERAALLDSLAVYLEKQSVGDVQPAQVHAKRLSPGAAWYAQDWRLERSPVPGAGSRPNTFRNWRMGLANDRRAVVGADRRQE